MRHLLCLAALALSSSALAGPITYQIDSDAHLRWGADVLGLDGQSFQFVTSPGDQFHYNEPFTSFAAGSRQLVLSGSDYDGSHSATRINAGTWTVDGRDYDALRFGGTRYQIGDYEVEIQQISVNFDAGFLNDGVDVLPEFTTDEVSSVSWFELRVWDDYMTVARYGSTYGTMFAQSVSVPEPGALALMGVGVIALAWRRRLANRGEHNQGVY